jgi:hypothetical protein
MDKIQHQKGRHTLYTLVNWVHQDNITNGHPYHHTTLEDLLKILRRGTKDQDHEILSPDDLWIVQDHCTDIKTHQDTLSQV